MTVSTQNLHISLGGTEILKEIDFHTKQHSFVGIIGPNGSGKSTLLKCIYRTLKPTSGAVLLDDISLQTLSLKQSAKKIAVVAQHNHYNFDFTVKDVVMLGRAPHKRMLDRDTKEDFQLVDTCLQQVGMQDFSERLFSSLSGGEQQRVLLARALAQQTPCLILDEPTNHLDIKYQLQLMDIVKSLGITVIAAIHDLNIAAMYCDYIYVMKHGEIVTKGTPKEVLTSKIIEEIYEVQADVIQQNGVLHILYHPGGKTK